MSVAAAPHLVGDLGDVLLRRVQRFRRCVYCGGVTKGSPLTCTGHQDLLALDPLMEKTKPAGPLAGSTAGSVTNGG